MGEIADMMINGDMCEGCGVFLGDAGDGYQRRCASCATDCVREGSTTTKDGIQIHRPSKVNCPHIGCRKLVKKKGLQDHIRDVHGGAVPA